MDLFIEKYQCQIYQNLYNKYLDIIKRQPS